MAQEHIVALWCDIELDEEGERIEGRTITWNGWEMEICGSCESRLNVAALDQVVEKYGRKAGSSSRPKMVKALTMTEYQGDGSDLDCPWGCKPTHGKRFASPRGLKMHLTRQHKGQLPSV